MCPIHALTDTTFCGYLNFVCYMDKVKFSAIFWKRMDLFYIYLQTYFYYLHENQPHKQN